MNKKLVERLKKLRTDNEWSQSKLASFLKVAQTTVAAWEVGRNEPDTRTLIQLAAFYDVSVDYLIGASNKMYHNETTATVSGSNNIVGNIKNSFNIKK